MSELEDKNIEDEGCGSEDALDDGDITNKDASSDDQIETEDEEFVVGSTPSDVDVQGSDDNNHNIEADSFVDSEKNIAIDEEEGDIQGEMDGFVLPLIQVVEAILFAADEALTIDRIAKAAGKRIRREAVVEAVEELKKLYALSDRAFEIVEVAEAFQMMTRAEFATNIQALYGKRAIKEEKDKKISPAVLDTLAIVAYKQPVTRAEVEAVRGVGCGQIMRQLMERGSIRPVGKKMDVIGYPLLYGTTEQFLQEFGLASLEVLPMAAELKRLTKIDLPEPEVVEGQGVGGEEVHSKLEGAVVIEKDIFENEDCDEHLLQEDEKKDTLEDDYRDGEGE